MFNMIKIIVPTVRGAIALMVLGVTVIATDAAPAVAGDRYTDLGRSATKYAYKGVGTSVCGRTCGAAGGYVGGHVYDQSRRFTDRFGGAARNAGTKINRAYCRKHPGSRVCRR